MSVARFELGEAVERVAGDQVNLTADKAAVVGINAVAVSGRRASAAARDASDVVKTVMSVRQPETMPLGGQAQPRMRFDLENPARVLNVLQRDEIHVAIEFVVGGEEVFEC